MPSRVKVPGSIPCVTLILLLYFTLHSHWTSGFLFTFPVVTCTTCGELKGFKEKAVGKFSVPCLRVSTVSLMRPLGSYGAKWRQFRPDNRRIKINKYRWDFVNWTRLTT